MNTVEVIYAETDTQKKITLRAANGATVEDVIRQSGLLDAFPQIDLRHNAVGIYGQRVALDRVVQSGDRVEIYRPLRQSPVEQRRKRVQTDT